MEVTTSLRINMTGLREDPAEESARYRAAIDMAAWADRQGYGSVNFEEHHCADNGWLPSPLLMAGMALARTERIRVSVAALLVTLYDPVRLAEDLAVLDLVAQGRFSFVAGLGYRPIEYHAAGKSWEDRGRLMDECLETLLQAWTGEPFEYKGQTIRVTPVPMSRPMPFFFLAGMTKVAVRRAARLGLPFFPAEERPDLEAYYHEELARHGKQGLWLAPGKGNAMTFIDPDPERAWHELAPYFLREQQEYASWRREGVRRPSEEAVESIDDLKAQGRFEILTAEDCKARIRAGTRDGVVLHPLAGGVPLDRAWELVERCHEEVVAPLRAEASP